MSGHSKWHSIRHKKAATDAKRGKILTKHSKILMVLGRNDPNPDTNASLRMAIINAKADSVPKDNIDRLLKKMAGTGKDTAQYSEQVYEGFGPDGIPFVITAITDNINRTFPAIRTAFNKAGGNLGSSGSVMFMFDHIGIVEIKTTGKSEDNIFELAVECGGEDIIYNKEFSKITTKMTELSNVRNALSEKGIEIIKSELRYEPKDPKMLSETEAEKMEKFIEAVEDVEDVDEVYGGFDVVN